jgi:hypothetical protein
MMTDWFSWFRKSKEERTMIKPHYVFIHGANQSRVCWNYIIRELELLPAQYTCIEYSSLTPFFDNLEEMKLIADELPSNCCFIGHSLGGIYAVHLYRTFSHKFLQGISISTPFGGSSAADYLRYISPQTKLFKEIGRKSIPIIQSQETEIKIPWTQLVTVRGNSPWLRSRNDGIVTERSMIIREDVEHLEVFANHYEVLVYDPVVDIIKEKTFKNLTTTP